VDICSVWGHALGIHRRAGLPRASRRHFVRRAVVVSNGNFCATNAMTGSQCVAASGQPNSDRRKRFLLDGSHRPFRIASGHHASGPGRFRLFLGSALAAEVPELVERPTASSTRRLGRRSLHRPPQLCSLGDEGVELIRSISSRRPTVRAPLHGVRSPPLYQGYTSAATTLLWADRPGL